MSWPQWSAGAQPAVTPVINPATPVINPAPAVVPPGLQYTPEQWAQMQQQNWNQWAQWQQQYQQWHQQYGAEYQKSMNALAQAAQAQQPVAAPLPNVAVPPPLPSLPSLTTDTRPPLPAEEPPPPVPSYNTAPPPPQPGYNTAPRPPRAGEQRPPVHYQKNQNQNWSNQQNYRYGPDNQNKRSFDQGNDHDSNKRQMVNKPGWQNQPPQPKVANVEELSEAEKKFDKQFAEWEAQFNKWKEQNVEHPDKEQYREYEKKWESWRAQLLERREQMKRKRLGLAVDSPKSRQGSGQGFNSPQPNFNQPPPKVPPNVAPKVGLLPTPPNAVTFNKPPPNLNDEPLKFKETKPVPELEDTMTDFIKPNTGGGIPGLDLVKDDPKPGKSATDDVLFIDPEEERERKGPDFDAISKGINSILGDQKLLNMLSMVSQTQNPKLNDNLTNTVSRIKEGYSDSNLPYHEQSNQSFEDHSNQSEAYAQREFVNNFDDQTRSSFTMANNDQETRFEGHGNLGRNQKFEQNRFGNFGKGNRFGNFENEQVDKNNLGRNDFSGRMNDKFPPKGDRFTGPQKVGPDHDRFGPNQERFSGPNQERFGPNQERFGPNQEKFGPNQERLGPNQERFGPNQERFGPNQERFGPNQEKFGPNQERFGPNQERFGQNQDRFGLNQDRFGTDQDNFGQENFGPNQGPNQRGPNQNRFGPNQGKFGPNQDRFGANKDRFGPNQERFGPNQDRFGPNQDRFGPNQDRFGPNQDRFGANKDRFGPNQERFGPNQDRFGPDQDRFGPNQDRFGPNQDRFGQNQNRFGPGNDRFGKFGPNKNQDRFPPNQDRFGQQSNEGFNRNNDRNFGPRGGPPPEEEYGYGDDNDFNQDPYSQDLNEENYDDNYDYERVAANFEEDSKHQEIDQHWKEDVNYEEEKYSEPVAKIEPPPAPKELPMFQPETVIDYDHKPPKPGEPEVLVEPIYMFDYRHKALSRIPIPQRPKWLADAVKNIREFDPPVVRPYELQNLRRYPPPVDNWRNERYQDNWSPHNRRYEGRPPYEERRPYGDRYEDRYDEHKGHERKKPYNEDKDKNFGEEKRGFSRMDLEEEKISDTEWPEDDEFEEEKPKTDFPKFHKPEPEKPNTNKNVVLIEDLINSPGRFKRPPRIVIILRGPPGSGKTFLAKLIKDKEVENGGSTPRILSLDDYFMVEQEKEVNEDGKKVKIKEMVFEYEAEMEESYRTSLIKSFKKTITDGYFSFIIVDNVNDKVKYFGEMWSFAKQNGFQVYICQLDLDAQTCSKRNIHGRSEADIEKCVANWEPTPSHHPILDATSLLQAASIPEVEMEEVNSPESDLNEADGSEDQVARSKWDNFDCSVDNLAKLDGVSKPLRQRTMEEYLQLDTEWTPVKPTKPGQKRVRWADLEEQKQQEKMRAIGFVVGHTNWDRMMDPTGGSSALTQTKYIERTGRYKVDQK